MADDIDDDLKRIQELRLEHKSRTRTISYNAMSMKEAGRWDDVEKFLGRNDVIGISGTCTRAKPAQQYTVRTQGKFEVIEWGYITGKPFTNPKCGVAIMLSKKKFPRSTWRTIYSPIQTVAGRIGAVRIRVNSIDVCFISFYSPIEPDNEKGREQVSNVTWSLKSLFKRCLTDVFPSY